MSLERRHYRLLIALDRERTVSAAARSLYITQSAASQQLRDAERRLGLELTNRSGRSVTLTAAAQRLVDAARTAEETLESAESDARWITRSTVSTLRLALGIYDTTHWLGPLLARLERDERAAPLELVRSSSPYGLERLTNGQAHVVIAPGGDHAFSERSHGLFEDRLVAVVGRHHRLARRKALRPRDFAQRSYVTFGTTPEQGFEYVNFLNPARAIPSDLLRMESTNAILRSVAGTDRLTILSRWTVPPTDDVVTIPLSPNPPPVAWSLLVGPLGGDPSLAATVDHLVEYFRAMASTDET